MASEKSRKIAVLSDIHANQMALEAVLADFEDDCKVWFLGDLFDPGPSPWESYKLLSNLQPEIWLAGNHDKSMWWLANSTLQDGCKSCYDGLIDLYKQTAEKLAKVIPDSLIENAANRHTQLVETKYKPLNIHVAHGFPSVDDTKACQVYDFDLAPGKVGKHVVTEQRAAIKEEQLCQLWIMGHSHRQTGWLYSEITGNWAEWVPGFGQTLSGGERFNQPKDRNPCTLCKAEIDLQPDSGNWLMLNPGSVGFPRDGIYNKEYNFHIAKYMRLTLNETHLEVDFRAVPYEFGLEALEQWRNYPKGVYKLIFPEQDDGHGIPVVGEESDEN
jgi:predicted phosphodiesterase